MGSLQVYHYTNFSKVGGILGKFQGEESGLTPRTYIGQAFGPAREKPATFALLETAPHSWIHNEHFPLTWKNLVHNLDILDNGKLLLEISVDPQEDDAFVGDRSHIEGVRYSDNSNIPERYRHKNLKEGERMFMESAIPLKEYLERQKRGEVSYSLPEVLIFNNIPADRIRVSESQPLIEDDLTKLHNEDRRHLVELILRGFVTPELAAWRRNYESTHGLLERSSGPESLG